MGSKLLLRRLFTSPQGATMGSRLLFLHWQHVQQRELLRDPGVKNNVTVLFHYLMRIFVRYWRRSESSMRGAISLAASFVPFEFQDWGAFLLLCWMFSVPLILRSSWTLLLCMLQNASDSLQAGMNRCVFSSSGMRIWHTYRRLDERWGAAGGPNGTAPSLAQWCRFRYGLCPETYGTLLQESLHSMAMKAWILFLCLFYIPNLTAFWFAMPTAWRASLGTVWSFPGALTRGLILFLSRTGLLFMAFCFLRSQTVRHAWASRNGPDNGLRGNFLRVISIFRG